MAEYAGFQNEIYLRGLEGTKPAFPLRYDLLEAAAKETLPPEAYGYVAGSAGSEDTARANVEAFRRWRIAPRMLNDVSSRDMSVEIFGQSFPAPVFTAPIGVQSIVHEQAELATARAAAAVGLPMVLSTAASNPIEAVAEANGDGQRWFQLYWPNDPELAVSFMTRAEAAGFSAIVVTLDTMLLAWRPRDLQNAYLPFLQGIGTANYFSDPVFREGLSDDPTAAVLKWVSVYSDPSTTWERLAHLRANTSLPIILKGITHPDDARAAVEAGMDGVIVSNHGGRQVDGAVASLDALPRVIEAVGRDLPVLFDSGIRTGADIFKAIALGARAVLVGRPYVWGLALGGAEGVEHVLRVLLAELDLTMALSGCASLAELDASRLIES